MRSYQCFEKQQPILIGTSTVEKSEFLSDLFKLSKIPHKILNAKPENIKRESEIVAEAGERGAVTIATNMAGRGTDIILGGNPDYKTKQKIIELVLEKKTVTDKEITNLVDIIFKEYNDQTEIKNWSAHAIGGRTAPPLDASFEDMKAFRLNRWRNCFDDAGQTLKDAKAEKVLVPMAPLEHGVEVRPLLIFWDSMHPEGANAEFFFVPVAPGYGFERLWVFSMSTFIRNLLSSGVEEIAAEMPRVHQRVMWLERIYSAD